MLLRDVFDSFVCILISLVYAAKLSAYVCKLSKVQTLREGTFRCSCWVVLGLVVTNQEAEFLGLGT